VKSCSASISLLRMCRNHNSDVTEKCNALFELRSGYCVKTVRSMCAWFQLDVERS
jgi:hypothetical protein